MEVTVAPSGFHDDSKEQRDGRPDFHNEYRVLNNANKNMVL